LVLVPFWARGDRTGLHGGPLATIVSGAPQATRLAICRRLLRLVAAAPVAERTTFGKSPAGLAASLVAEAWPPQENVGEVLDVILALGEEELPEHEMDYARSRLADALALPGVDPSPVLDRLVEARVAGYAGAWTGLWSKADKLLERGPGEVLRRAAERALESEDTFTLQWAAGRLLGAAFDPAVDGEPLDRVRALWAEPGRRAALAGDPDFVRRALPVLRSALRKNELSYPEAAATIEGIGRLYGGLANGGMTMGLIRMNRTRPEAVEAARLAAQDAAEPFLGPPELRGPPAEVEWEALRRARSEHVSNDLEERSRLWLRTLASGPWTAEERADLDAFFALFREGHTDALAFALGSALAAKPEVELVPRFDEIVRLCDEDCRPLMKRLRAAVGERLGLGMDEPTGASLAAEPAGGGAAPGEEEDDELPGGEWGDDGDDGAA